MHAAIALRSTLAVRLSHPTSASQMYKYGGAEGGHEELRQFCTSGYREVQALNVPPEPSPLEALLRAVRRSPWVLRAMEVGHTFGAHAGTVCAAQAGTWCYVGCMCRGGMDSSHRTLH